MFDEINDQNVNKVNVPVPEIGSVPNFNQNIPKPAEDILEEVDQSVKPAVFQPIVPTPSVGYVPDDKELGATDSKKFFVLGVIIVVIILIIGIGYFGFKYFLDVRMSNKAVININNNLASSSADVIPENPNIKNPIIETGVSAIIATSTNENSEIIATTTGVNENHETIATTTGLNVELTTIVDSDQDGLTDDEERLLGTDPNASDTDNDGLSDREELKVYNTNPLSADTDGDGYKDGDEVKNGYNPNGAGKL
ncbi:thrombospondin type 3 repeat-containing protein [Patescibacteria group bacterium]|nr:thrombospondin type 3 repeat-containing protein [Patescibacteria group bacterium]MBU0880243.1 thrombospondin type 3 repeat-containing protein [Patescibacteria group bacterium]MBU1783549.1 thrombospondin type 3 repeat-containing protein [Patescibacteria group bacterium]MBU1991749.1 thrombospondin type 3 repeat-containing protein [Patescibacteria group bacterium]MBU2081518.1 thrombospondin type 3 repeat-containing protein [Patescibacteria group bacterium]